MGDQLTDSQQKDLQSLLDEFSGVFQTKPGKTTLAEHCIFVKKIVDPFSYHHIDSHKLIERS